VTVNVITAYVSILCLRPAIRALWYLHHELGPGGQRPRARHLSLHFLSYS